MTTEAKLKASAPTSVMQYTSKDVEQFGVKAPSEVVGILQALSKNHDFVSVYFNNEQDYLLTTVLSVAADGRKLYMDVGANTVMNRRAEEAATVTCVTNHDKVKIQFELARLTATTFEQRPAFSAAIPSYILRFQRRAYYRLQLPSSPHILFNINVTQGDGTPTIVEVKLNDISVGGVNLTIPPTLCNPEIGDVFKDCRIQLPEVGTIKTTLAVRNREVKTLRSGVTIRRLGCEFLRLSSAEEALVQRFIFVTDRGIAARKQALRK